MVIHYRLKVKSLTIRLSLEMLLLYTTTIHALLIGLANRSHEALPHGAIIISKLDIHSLLLLLACVRVLIWPLILTVELLLL